MSPPGQLWVIATPIGNLSDLSPRAADSLRNATLIAAEDTRRTRNLLRYLGLQKPLLRCDERAEEHATRRVLEALQAGQNVALVSDAGTPSLADPGARLIESVQALGIPIVPIPGPSAITTALSVAGFRATHFRFYGFLPKKSGAREREMKNMLASGQTAVFFESPQRLSRTLRELAAMEAARPACVGRELTKIHEEIRRGTLHELADYFGAGEIRGECTVVIGPLKKSDLRKRKKIDSAVEEE